VREVPVASWHRSYSWAFRYVAYRKIRCEGGPDTCPPCAKLGLTCEYRSKARPDRTKKAQKRPEQRSDQPRNDTAETSLQLTLGVEDAQMEGEESGELGHLFRLLITDICVSRKTRAPQSWRESRASQRSMWGLRA